MPLQFQNIQHTLESLFLSFDLSLEEGTFVGITGPNGAGKSAVLRLAAGDLRPDAGMVRGASRTKLVAESSASVNVREIRQFVFFA